MLWDEISLLTLVTARLVVAHAPLVVAHAPLVVAHAPLVVAHAPLADRIVGGMKMRCTHASDLTQDVCALIR